MLGQPIQWSHVTILARAYFRFAIRGGSGLVFLLAFMTIGLSVAGFMIDPLKQQIKNARKQVKQQIGGRVEVKDEDLMKPVVQFARPIVAWWVGADETDNKDPLVEHLVIERPPILSAYLVVLFVIVPFTACLGAFNQLSGDIGTKGLRYLLLRTERINIIVARFLGTLLFTAAVTLAVILIVVVYISVNFDSESFGSLLAWGLRGWLATMAFSLPYICLCTLISASIDSPIIALFLCLLTTGFPIIVINIAQTVTQSQLDLEWLDLVTPWGWKFDLLHPSFGKAALAYLIMLISSALLYFLAVWHFLRRDL